MVSLDVEGMSCSGCEKNVVDALADVSGVESVEADHESGTVTVTGRADVTALVPAIENAGYDVRED